MVPFEKKKTKLIFSFRVEAPKKYAYFICSIIKMVRVSYIVLNFDASDC